jgi:hypothetical protein
MKYWIKADYYYKVLYYWAVFVRAQ